MGTIYRAVGGDDFVKITVIEARDIAEREGLRREGH